MDEPFRVDRWSTHSVTVTLGRREGQGRRIWKARLLHVIPYSIICIEINVALSVTKFNFVRYIFFLNHLVLLGWIHGYVTQKYMGLTADFSQLRLILVSIYNHI